ncbi:MAG: transcription antitermination factor NusB [Myxococcales bacterium]|nr:transcription antitermination factor NusB [Myxococcales bacterium]
MGNRHKAREFTLQILYQHDAVETPIELVLDLFWRDIQVPPEVREFSDRLVYGVLANQKQIDDLLAQYSENWTLDRMTGVDRNILRVATFEILHCPEIPKNVTINEAVEIGKRFGTEDSGAFINGIIDKIARDFKGQEEPEGQ